MDAKLRYVEIKKLFGQYDVEWNIDKDTTVLVGQNGSGKTTILYILISIFMMKEYRSGLRDCLSASKVKFSNENEIVIKQDYSQLVGVLSSVLDGSFKDKDKKIDEFRKVVWGHLSDLNIDVQQDNYLHNYVSEMIDPFGMNVTNYEMREPIKIEFVSTVNMSANAVNSVTASDGKPLNILDIEIEQAIINFQKLRENEKYLIIKDKLLSVLNDFFRTTNKSIILFGTDLIIENTKKEVLKLSQLSAGERQIIYIVFKVATAYFNEALILMDEPEISLHLEWQEKLLKNLREINDKSQMIVVTHSPAIIMDGWMDSYVDIQTILKPIKDDE